MTSNFNNRNNLVYENSIINDSRKNYFSSMFSLDKNREFNFLKPPECPVFTPNEDEFKDPLLYIDQIRPFAEKYGIAKIKPPKSWIPPFAINVENFKFSPRIQHLNKLEAKTRIKSNFSEKVNKFWVLQGSSLKIPILQNKVLDLYNLHRIIQEEGGFEQTTKERKWSKVAERMKYDKKFGVILKSHYQRILYPFDVHTSEKTYGIKLDNDYEDYIPHSSISRQKIISSNEAQATCTSATTHSSKRESPDMYSNNFNVKKATDKCRITKFPRQAIVSLKKIENEDDPLAKYVCQICNQRNAEETMLLCDACDDSYHTFCLIPPLDFVPKSDWHCPKCVIEEVSKPKETFGFEQAQHECTLQKFGKMANKFKIDYFNMLSVPTDLVEREFWRILSSVDEDVTVQYGTDISKMDYGSGFPTKSSLNLSPDDQEYVKSSWNLNNLPILEESIFGHINANISGMKIPWMYVGMCYATFCWHNEDHWSYSINYLHWGEPKTWYGIPGSQAEAFEETMKTIAPELFNSQPDLLHQLVTLINPNTLMENNVSVYRTDQHAGEFVVTFPRAYHAGFNQGYNFAEAVNFALADWIKMGRECINHYSNIGRFCVFSHDELICKMALNPYKLNLAISTACYLDMITMIESEKKLRNSLLINGITKADRKVFELIPDDERQCDLCKTTCFLSAITCSCTKTIVCLKHIKGLCACPPEEYILHYRFTLDELSLILKKLLLFKNWLLKVENALSPLERVITFMELQNLVKEAKENKFSFSPVFLKLNAAFLQAEKCIALIRQLNINQIGRKTQNSGEPVKYKLKIEELELFVQEIKNLCCILPEEASLIIWILSGKNFIETAKHILSKPLSVMNLSDLEQLYEKGSGLHLDLQEVEHLKRRLEQLKWYKKVREYRNAVETISLNMIRKFLKEGLDLVPDHAIEKELLELKKLLIYIENWQDVKEYLEPNTQSELSKSELLENRANDKLVWVAKDNNEKTSGEELRQININENKTSTISQCKDGTFSITNTNTSNSTEISTNHVQKSNIPLIRLNKITREILEDSMLEEGIVELSMDETSYICKIIRITKSCSGQKNFNSIHLLPDAKTLTGNKASGSKKREAADDSLTKEEIHKRKKKGGAHNITAN